MKETTRWPTPTYTSTMSNKTIVRIDPVPRQFSVTWMLGSRCNYECMYCPTELHDKSSQHHDLATLQRTWRQIVHKSQHLNLPYKISFTGGEITTNRNFLPLIAWIKSQSDTTQIFICSNGSAGLGYYLRVAKLVNGISLSTHSEFMDEKKFFAVAKALNTVMIRPDKSLHVNIMDEHWNGPRNELYKKFCDENDISHSVNRIDYTRQNRIAVWHRGKENLDHV